MKSIHHTQHWSTTEPPPLHTLTHTTAKPQHDSNIINHQSSDLHNGVQESELRGEGENMELWSQENIFPLDSKKRKEPTSRDRGTKTTIISISGETVEVGVHISQDCYGT